MDLKEIIFLPGLRRQFKFLNDHADIRDKSVLIAGSNTEIIAKKFLKKAKEVIVIVNDQEDLSRMRFNLPDESNLSIRFMDFSNTDFINRTFDIIYAQASISRSDRNKILKEFKKILTQEGLFCTGEIVSISENPPQFVKDLWQQSNLFPLHINKIEDYYKEKGFQLIGSKDLSDSLKEFYSLSNDLLKETASALNVEEKKYYRKLITHMEHETKVYLKLGGHRHIGFKSFLFKLQNEEK